jgi:hypothetical protein
MKRLFITTFLVLSIFFVSFSAHSATLTVDVAGLDTLLPDGLVSYQMNFDVSGGLFTTVDFSIDQNSIFTALGGANQTGTNLVVLSYNNFNPTPLLVDGDLFTITYPDTVSLSLSFDSFILSDNATVLPMNQSPGGAIFSAGDNFLTMSPVPIPSAVLLLGSGLLALVGTRRRMRS